MDYSSGVATAITLQDSSAEQRWTDQQYSQHQRVLYNLLGTLELELHLPPKTLANDETMAHVLEAHPSGDDELTKEEIILLVLDAGRNDTLHRAAYESESYNVRETTPERRYKGAGKDLTLLEARSDFADVISVGTPQQLKFADDDSDFDESASLMECGLSYSTKSISEAEADAFKLNKVLADLRLHHHSISTNFKDIDVKLSLLRRQNSRDLNFLKKLTENNDFMRERMSEMRTELTELNAVFDEVRSKYETNEAPIAHSSPVLETVTRVTAPYELDEFVLSLATRATKDNIDPDSEHNAESQEGIQKAELLEKEKAIGAEVVKLMENTVDVEPAEVVEKITDLALRIAPETENIAADATWNFRFFVALLMILLGYWGAIHKNLDIKA